MWHHIHTYMDPSWVMEDFTTSTLATDFIDLNRKPVFHRTKTHATGWLWHEATWENLGKTSESPMKCLCETGPDLRCTLGVQCLVFGVAGGAVSSNTPPVTTPKPNACADERIWITSPCGSSMSRKKKSNEQFMNFKDHSDMTYSNLNFMGLELSSGNHLLQSCLENNNRMQLYKSKVANTFL